MTATEMSEAVGGVSIGRNFMDFGLVEKDGCPEGVVKGPAEKGFCFWDWLVVRKGVSSSQKDKLMKMLPYETDKTTKKIVSAETLETFDGSLEIKET